MNTNYTKKITASILERNNENTITCAYCGAIIAPGTEVEFEGSYYCPEHLDEVSFVCDDCGERKPIAEANYVNGADVCDSCLDDERGYFRCANCGDIHSMDNSNSVYTSDDNSQLWCDRCVEDYADYCDECERHFDGRVVFVTDCTCEYCASKGQECGDIRYWSAPIGVRSYSYKPNPCFCMTEEQQQKYTPTDLVHFGFELEMEDHRNYGDNADGDADYMNEQLGFTYCKHDGSLDNGIELVSHPATLEYLMEKKDVFEEVFKKMTNRGYRCVFLASTITLDYFLG